MILERHIIRRNGNVITFTISAGYETLIDQYKWFAAERKNKRRTITYIIGYKKGIKVTDQKLILLHNLIMDKPDGCDIHHIDEIGLHNEIENLEIISISNHRRFNKYKNKTGKRCVNETPHGKFMTRVHINKKCHYLGVHPTREIAEEVGDKFLKGL